MSETPEYKKEIQKEMEKQEYLELLFDMNDLIETVLRLYDQPDSSLSKFQNQFNELEDSRLYKKYMVFSGDGKNIDIPLGVQEQTIQGNGTFEEQWRETIYIVSLGYGNFKEAVLSGEPLAEVKIDAKQFQHAIAICRSFFN